MSPTNTRISSRLRIEEVPGNELYVFAIHTTPERQGSFEEEEGTLRVCTYGSAGNEAHACALLTFVELNMNIIAFFWEGTSLRETELVSESTPQLDDSLPWVDSLLLAKGHPKSASQLDEKTARGNSLLGAKGRRNIFGKRVFAEGRSLFLQEYYM